jgi:hypothetical protein
VVATAARLKVLIAHTSFGKDFVEYDNPYNVGMTGIVGSARRSNCGRRKLIDVMRELWPGSPSHQGDQHMIPPTKHRLPAMACLSAMQKRIRRGMKREAMEFAVELIHTSKRFNSTVAKRLEVIAMKT